MKLIVAGKYNIINFVFMVIIVVLTLTLTRPYFIGSLGFRNGWALSDEYKDELLEKTFEIGIEVGLFLKLF